MVVYRIAKARYAGDLSGEGARLSGGRWNHKGVSCIYTARSRALAVLEYSVNVNIEDIPRALSIITLEVPDSIESISVADLPGNWMQNPATSYTKNFGTGLLKKAGSLIIEIPSVVIPEEWNYIINPANPDARLIKLCNCSDYPYDVRIKRV